ncbi:MAG: Lrp/AsnC family transcriptional regulator [Naasia sp.]|uniref:Lrp/AsnC family transcriptional regulator n=1 Tax=Naasia sp. TaxID=2546198 RepID=UPI00261E34A7|nr:Lrp/AsnC family transcriptional regulator [Naasia sp.]MCU1569716.1 Lrp/AsnC family transcriptional regulator [Naasia sp.]
MLDSTDHGIIRLLATDGRRPYTSIAAQLEVSEATVRTRVGKLHDTGVLRIVALCSPLTLGHQSVRFLISVRDYSVRAVASTLAQIRMVNHIALITGGRDIYLEATCRDLEQLVDLVDEIRHVAGVDEIDQFILTELYKDYSSVAERGRLGTSVLGTPR